MDDGVDQRKNGKTHQQNGERQINGGGGGKLPSGQSPLDQYDQGKDPEQQWELHQPRVDLVEKKREHKEKIAGILKMPDGFIGKPRMT